MRKIFLLVGILILFTGCSSVQNKELDNILNEALQSKVSITNVDRMGYRYYLPRGISIRSSSDFNETFTDQKYLYYLYVDVVSYYNTTTFTYNVNLQAYYSSSLAYQDKKGYVEINYYENDKYLIEIMYNYAKIEVVVYLEDINKVVLYAMSILSSITYNDSVIENYLGDDIFESTEENYNIFEIVGSSNYIEFTQVEEETETIIDPDYIN